MRLESSSFLCSERPVIILAESESMMTGLSEQRNEELSNLMEKIRSLDLEMEALKSSSNDNQLRDHAEVEDIQEMLASVSAERDAIEKRCAGLEEYNHSLEARLQDSDKACALQVAELEDLTKSLSGKQQDMSKFEQKLVALKDKYGEK